MEEAVEKREIGYRKVYRMRRLFPEKKHCLVGMPWQVIERQSALRNITPEEFMERFVVVAEYDNFEGVRYTFKETGKEPV